MKKYEKGKSKATKTTAFRCRRNLSLVAMEVDETPGPGTGVPDDIHDRGELIKAVVGEVVQ